MLATTRRHDPLSKLCCEQKHAENCFNNLMFNLITSMNSKEFKIKNKYTESKKQQYQVYL